MRIWICQTARAEMRFFLRLSDGFRLLLGLREQVIGEVWGEGFDAGREEKTRTGVPVTGRPFLCLGVERTRYKALISLLLSLLSCHSLLRGPS